MPKIKSKERQNSADERQRGAVEKNRGLEI